MRTIFIFTIVVFLVCFTSGAVIFFQTRSPVGKVFESGRVLGVSEFADLIPLAQSLKPSSGLPASEDAPVVVEGTDNEPQRTDSRAEFALSAVAGAVMDRRTGTMLYGKNADSELPIASITILATALVFLENNPGWENYYTIRSFDRREGGRIYLSTGEKVRVRDLFYLSLVGSANTATMALVHSTGMDSDEFTRAMNEKVSELGLNRTVFKDPIGLSAGNISTAFEVARLVQAAMDNEDISRATLTRRYEFTTLKERRKVVYNTDALLDIFPQNGIIILGGKTGYNNAAGYCFAGKFKNADEVEVISVILGDNGKTPRFEHTKELVEWVFGNYMWE